MFGSSVGHSQRLAECNSAIRQTPSLRYARRRNAKQIPGVSRWVKVRASQAPVHRWGNDPISLESRPSLGLPPTKQELVNVRDRLTNFVG
jgi:hypothetical protein